MAFYDVNAAIDKPNFLNSFRQGQQYGQQLRQQQQAQQDQNALRTLAPQIIAGNPAAFDQAAAIDPEAAGKYQGAGDAQLKRLGGAIDYIDNAKKSGNPQAIEAAYQQVRPYLAKFGNGQQPPATFAEAEPKMEEARARIAMARQGGTQGRVQSTYIDNAGNRVAIMADGSQQVLGPNAPNNQIIDTGNGFYGVNKGNLSAAPVIVGGSPQQGPQQPGQQQVPQAPAMQQVQYATSDGSAIPPEEQAIAARAMAASARGEDVDIPVGGSAPMQGGALPPALDMVNGGQLRSAPKQASPIEQERLRLAQEANDRAAAVANKPSAMQERIDLARSMGASEAELQAIVMGNASTKGPSAAEQKDAMTRKAKQPQVQNAVRGLSRIESALEALNGGLIDTGPVDAKVQRYTKAGQELEAAVGGIQNSFLSLTRVPGIGSQSDLEARIASMQYPSLDKDPEVNRRTMENLRAFAEDLQEAYRLADAPSGNRVQNTSAVVDGPRGGPQPGAVQDGYRFKGGNPADPTSWERL